MAVVAPVAMHGNEPQMGRPGIQGIFTAERQTVCRLHRHAFPADGFARSAHFFFDTAFPQLIEHEVIYACPSGKIYGILHRLSTG